jgi:hypothetical protein
MARLEKRRTIGLMELYNAVGKAVLAGEKEIVIDGDLDLTGAGSRLMRLPDNLTVHGDMNVSYTNLDHLPEGLKVDGDIYVQESGVLRASRDLHIGGRIGGTLIGLERNWHNLQHFWPA